MRIKNWRIPFLFLIASGFVISIFSHGADFVVNNSSNPVGSPILGVMVGCGPGDMLGTLLINSRGTSNETIKIYDSSGTANNLIGTVALSTAAVATAAMTANEYDYNLRISSCITVTKSGATSDITILWKKIR